jgi:hypothetical protein
VSGFRELSNTVIDTATPDPTEYGTRPEGEEILEAVETIARGEELIDTRSRFGVNLSVSDSLSRGIENIKFINGSSGGMQGAVAYIQYWSRKGTTQRVPSGTPVSDVPASKVEETGRVVQELTSPETDPPPKEEVRQEVSTPNIPVNANSRPATGREENIESNRRRAESRRRSTVKKPPETGEIYSANPGAIAEKQKPDQTVFYDDRVNGKWQFLFNPEELQLESGPEYNRAETWAVSDRENSGQPLSWRGNKNRKLTFGKVLLTGYVIGKRVDSLEAGLQELFMARDGENGADGPPVLEFVWGARVFGPCVIQNLRVTEKAWDYGLLVNAEVSFELEQVPEWTINDGFVDIARPGRQSTINDPALPSASTPGASGEQATTGTGTPPPPPQPASIPGGSGGNSRENKLKEAECKNLNSDFAVFDSLSKDLDVLVKTAAVIKTNAINLPLYPYYQYPPYVYAPKYREKVERYKPLIIKLVKNSFYTPQLRTNGTTNLPLSCREIGVENQLKKYSEEAKKILSGTGDEKNKQERLKNLDVSYLRELKKCSDKAKAFPLNLILQRCETSRRR